MEYVKITLRPFLLMVGLLIVTFFVKSPVSVWLSPPIQIADRYYMSAPLSNFTEYGLVTSVADGDTITVNESQKVRLLGIDTPELSHPQQRIREECYGRNAKARMEQLVLYKYVYLLRTEKDKDKYGRSLRYIFVQDNTNAQRFLLINAYMVGEGFARAYMLNKNDPYKELINSFQMGAKEDGAGLWGNCDRNSFRW